MEVAAKRRLPLTMALVVAAVIVAAAAGAQTFTQVLSFQGRLCATDGMPVPDGHYTVQFTIYDAAIDGDSLWQETQDVTQIGGVFTVRLGSVNPFEAGLFTDGDRWLGIKVGADPEIADRYPFTPSPWALYAASAGPDNDWTISGANIYRLSGNVGIGLNAPGYTLHVESRGQRAVFADSTAASGTNYAVYGRLASTSGAGVFGEATASTGTANGVVGFTGTPEGSGVFGQNTNHSGENEGVYGVAWSPSGRGVMGYNGASSGLAVGVLGRTASSSGRAVYGEAQNVSGGGVGIYGETHSPDGSGVVGTSDGDGWGVYAYSETGYAVMGSLPHGSGRVAILGGIQQQNGGVLYVPNCGVAGSTESGYGVAGRTVNGIGVYGVQDDSGNYGYLGTSTEGVYGRSALTDGAGVVGMATAASGLTEGVYGETHSPNGVGVKGVTTNSNGSGVAGVNGIYTGYLGYGTAGAMGRCHGNTGYLGDVGAGVRGEADDPYCAGVVGQAIGECLTGVYGEAGPYGSSAGVVAHHGGSGHRATLATGSHAGYFEGDVHTTAEYTKAYTPGTANPATPIAYGCIATDGSVYSGTPNVSCTLNVAQTRYEITISGETYYYPSYTTVVSPIGAAVRTSTTSSVSGKLLVYIFDGSGNKVQNTFQFVVYKP
jgi:hypothetical protein